MMTLIVLTPVILLVFGIILMIVLWVLRKNGKIGAGRSESVDADGEKISSGSKGQSESQDLGNHKTTRMAFRYADDTIWVHENSVFTGVRLNAITDEQLSMEELHQQVEAAAGALNDLATGEPIEVMGRLTFRPVSAEDWYEQLIESSWNPSPFYKDYNARIADLLDYAGTSRPEYYVIVKIGNVTRKGHEAISRRLDAMISGVHEEDLDSDAVASWQLQAKRMQRRLEYLGGGAEPMTRQDLMWLIRKPMHGHMTPGSMNWMSSRPWGAGDFTLAAQMNAQNKRTHLVLEQVNENPNSAQYEMGEKVESHTCFLAVSGWPREQVFRRDSAWIRYIARLDLDERVEMTHRMTVVPSRTFAKDAKKWTKNLNEEIENISNSGKNPDQNLIEDAEEARMLQADIEKYRIPGVEGQIFFQLSAPTYRKLEDMRHEFTQLLKHDLDVTVVRPGKFQWRIMEMFLPGSRPQIPAMPYVRMQESNVFAGGLPNTGTEVGDKVSTDRTGKKLGWIGDYIGSTADGTPVHFSTHVGLSKNSGAGIATVGASGGGKSTLALIKFFLESEAGVRTVALDPKVDFAQFCYYIAFGSQVNHPEFKREARQGILGTDASQFTVLNEAFWNETLIVDVLRSEDGLLDCFAVARNVADGRQLAETVFEIFLGEKEYDKCHNEILNALSEVVGRYDERVAEVQERGGSRADINAVPRPTMWEVVEEVVRVRDAAKEASVGFERENHYDTVVARLDALRKSPVSRLCFGENTTGQDTSRWRGDFRRTVFTMRGLKMPKDANPARWSSEQRRAAGIMHIITKFASEMLEVDEEQNPVTGKVGLRPKLLFVDEAYAVSATESGRDLLKTTLAQGRSYKTGVWIIDQLAGRLAKIEDENSEETGGNQLSTVFAYLHKTAGEAKKALPLLGRDGNATTEKALQPMGRGGSLETGRAVMKDAESRVAVISIDVPFVELLAATDTNPTTRPERQSRDLSADPWDWTLLDPDIIAQSVQNAAHLVESTEDDVHDDGSEETPATSAGKKAQSEERSEVPA